MHIGSELEGLNSKYLAALGFSRLTRIGFWVTMANRIWSFWFLIAADTFHTLLVIGFALSYFKIRAKTKDSSVLTFSGNDNTKQS